VSEPTPLAYWVRLQGHTKYHQASRQRVAFEDGMRSRVHRQPEAENAYEHAGFRAAFRAGWKRTDDAIRKGQKFVCDCCGSALERLLDAVLDRKKRTLSCPLCKGTDFSYQEKVWTSRRLGKLDAIEGTETLSLGIFAGEDVLSDSEHDACLFCNDCARELTIPEGLEIEWL